MQRTLKGPNLFNFYNVNLQYKKITKTRVLFLRHIRLKV